jgi:hypothetical protein
LDKKAKLLAVKKSGEFMKSVIHLLIFFEAPFIFFLGAKASSQP